jgi:hypothetical protein
LVLNTCGGRRPSRWPTQGAYFKTFGHPDCEQGLCNAKHLAGQLDKRYSSAAASLREGLEEMFTVARLGIDGRLAKRSPPVTR